MRHAKDLLLSRPFFERIPDQGLIVGDTGAGTYHVRGTRDRAGTYAFVYFPAGRSAELDLTPLMDRSLIAWWYDPRSGVAQRVGFVDRDKPGNLQPPASGPDWVLVLDTASSGYQAPGSAPYRQTGG